MNGVDGLAESVKRVIRNVKKGYKTNAQRGRIVENDLKEASTNRRVFLVEVSGSNRRYLVEETREEMTANMLRENISPDIISRVTSLPIDQITEIGKMRGLL